MSNDTETEAPQLSYSDYEQEFDRAVARLAQEYGRNATVLYTWRSYNHARRTARIVIQWSEETIMIINFVMHRSDELSIETTFVRVAGNSFSFCGNEAAAHETIAWYRALTAAASTHARTLARSVRWAFRLDDAAKQTNTTKRKRSDE